MSVTKQIEQLGPGKEEKDGDKLLSLVEQFEPGTRYFGSRRKHKGSEAFTSNPDQPDKPKVAQGAALDFLGIARNLVG